VKFILLMLLSFSVNAQLITWAHPTEREDGTPLPVSQISGYTIFCYDSEGLETQFVTAAITAYDVVLPAGDYVCSMITYDTDGRYSERSNKTNFVVTIANPAPPVIQ